MKASNLVLAALAAGFLSSVAPAQAASGVTASAVQPSADPVIPVAEGCGPGRWRGPWGGCRGPGWGAAPAYGWNGCPPGYWHGPWGHCRDTPYHGRLPGGGWR